MNRTYDIRAALPAISAPTLVIHLEGNQSIPAAHGEFIACHPRGPVRPRPGH